MYNWKDLALCSVDEGHAYVQLEGQLMLEMLSHLSKGVRLSNIC